MTETSAPRNARARVRDELTREIKAAARGQLAEQGSSALSLRAVARELGMVSSAVYRYFPSRDDLLTALIVDAYNAVGDAAETAASAVRPADLSGRFLAATKAFRLWALEHRHEYALIFGSPVPGYRAPTDTVDPAARIPILLLGILTDALAAGRAPRLADVPLPRGVRADMKALRTLAAPALSEPYLVRAVMVWTQVVGSISFELFGHLENVVHDFDTYFEHQMRLIAADLGLR